MGTATLMKAAVCIDPFCHSCHSQPLDEQHARVPVTVSHKSHCRVLVCKSFASVRIILHPIWSVDNNPTMVPVQVPLALDCLGNYILIAFAPLELTLLHVVVSPASGPNKSPTAKFHTVRQLSIMSVGQPIMVCIPSLVWLTALSNKLA